MPKVVHKGHGNRLRIDETRDQIVRFRADQESPGAGAVQKFLGTARLGAALIGGDDEALSPGAVAAGSGNCREAGPGRSTMVRGGDLTWQPQGKTGDYRVLQIRIGGGRAGQVQSADGVRLDAAQTIPPRLDRHGDDVLIPCTYRLFTLAE